MCNCMAIITDVSMIILIVQKLSANHLFTYPQHVVDDLNGPFYLVPSLVKLIIACFVCLCTQCTVRIQQLLFITYTNFSKCSITCMAFNYCDLLVYKLCAHLRSSIIANEIIEMLLWLEINPDVCANINNQFYNMKYK